MPISKKYQTGDSLLNQRILEWLSWDRNSETRKFIEDLADAEKFDVLRELLCSRLGFGTAGIRGKMGPGFNRINELVVIQTSQGLAKYLLDYDKQVKNRGVVIGYDGRRNSKIFAQRAAIAFLSLGIPVYLFSRVVPTPFIPFSVRKLICSAGIMCTASHNPKDDNGYKVYFSNGAQITSPHDKEIQDSILKNLEPWEGAWILNKIETVVDKLAEVEKIYYEEIEKRLFDRSIISSADLRVTHTSLHGVAHHYMMTIFKKCGSKNVCAVEEQAKPHPEFPTVAFPNPEEKGALDLAIKTAKQTDSALILANDPDADRLCVGEKQKDGSYRIFTGNELGILLGSWLWFVCKTKKSVKPKDCYMLGSTVSTRFLRTLAEAEGFNFIETLTGFKWLGNRAYELIKEGKTVLFAFEEALGYMCGSHIFDKDGITAGIEILQYASYIYSTTKTTLSQQLDQLYDKYGYHYNLNSYFICYETPVIKTVFERISSGPNNHATSIGPYKITQIRDLHKCFDSSTPDKRPTFPCSTSSFMVTFVLENNVTLTIRTSGTEPKVKYYSEIIAKPGYKRKKVEEELLSVIENFKKDLIPEIAFSSCP